MTTADDAALAPHGRLADSALAWYDRLRGDRRMPRRADVDFDDVGRIASRSIIIRVGPDATLEDMRIVNVGTEIEEAAGRKLTGMTLAAFSALLADDERTDHCLQEYGEAAKSAAVRTHTGAFRMRDGTGVDVPYERIILPLGADDSRVDHLLVLVDFLSRPTPQRHHPPTEPKS